MPASRLAAIMGPRQQHQSQAAVTASPGVKDGGHQRHPHSSTPSLTPSPSPTDSFSGLQFNSLRRKDRAKRPAYYLQSSQHQRDEFFCDETKRLLNGVGSVVAPRIVASKSTTSTPLLARRQQQQQQLQLNQQQQQHNNVNHNNNNVLHKNAKSVAELRHNYHNNQNMAAARPLEKLQLQLQLEPQKFEQPQPQPQQPLNDCDSASSTDVVVLPDKPSSSSSSSPSRHVTVVGEQCAVTAANRAGAGAVSVVPAAHFGEYAVSPRLQLRHLNSLRYLRSLDQQQRPDTAMAGGSSPIAHAQPCVHHHHPLHPVGGVLSMSGGLVGYDMNGHVAAGSGSSRTTDLGDVGRASVRSWTSVGMGSTDGKKMIVRRVPTSPDELFNIVHPPTPPEEYLYDDSYDGTESNHSLYFKKRRPQWANKLQFVLACVGYSVGLGSVWRFPYLAYKSGGGVFLIPYAITMIICGVPLLYMELAVGQFTGRGPIGALGHLCPLFKGTGLASVVISFIMSTYYCVIIAYGIYYFFSSFKSEQPWMVCSNSWNTGNCWNSTMQASYTNEVNISKPFHTFSPAEEFFNKKVLQVGNGIEDFEPLRWELVACLLFAWILVYFAIWKSIKSSAKVRYLTATLPFVLIVIFMGKSLTTAGANKGMYYFFRPEWHRLAEAKVWINALAQTFNSMGIAFGSMICFASYNKFNNNILHDTLAVSFVNAVTSILVGILTFSTIGNIAHELGKDIEDVIVDGPGLIFVVFPQAISKMPAAHVWAVLFFFMLISLALNSQFAIVEVVVTSIQDGFPSWIKKRLICHEMLVFVVCVISFFCGFPNVTRGGIYYFQLIDHYAASISIMYIAFTEVIAVAWFYGVWRLSRNIEEMTGRTPSLYLKFCWVVAAPLLIFSVFVFHMITYERPTYNNESYQYPMWALAIGWIITSVSLVCIIIFALVNFVKAEGESYREKFSNLLKPNIFECPKCMQHHCEHHNQNYDSEPMLDMMRPMTPVTPGTQENGGLMMGRSLAGSTAPSSPLAGRKYTSAPRHPASTSSAESRQ